MKAQRYIKVMKQAFVTTVSMVVVSLPKAKHPSKLFQRSTAVSIWSLLSQTKRTVRFMTYSDTMTAKVLIRFMKRLISSSKKKIFLILDNLRVHHAKLVKEWLAKPKIKEQIEVFYLPAYSPELNPDEYLNCDLKTGIHTGDAPKNEKALKGRVVSHIRMLQKHPDRVKKYFKHRSICYAA